MTPHDSTRCAGCGHDVAMHTYAETDICRIVDCCCSLSEVRQSPSEAVGAVDFAAADKYAEFEIRTAPPMAQLSDRAQEANKLARAYLALREQVATLTADNERLESRVGRLQESVNKMSGWADDERNPLARATPAEGVRMWDDEAEEKAEDVSGRAWSIVRRRMRDAMDLERKEQPYERTSAMLDAIAAKCADEVLALRTTPPRSPATVTEAVKRARQYIHHRDDEGFQCAEHRDGPDTCDCGATAAFNALTAALGGPDAL